MLVQENYSRIANNYPNTCMYYYRKVWQSKLPGKIKITNWRVFNNFLPTNNNLYYKSINNSAVCPRCTDGIETLEHVFRDCTAVKEIWKELKIKYEYEPRTTLNMNMYVAHSILFLVEYNWMVLTKNFMI